MGTRFERQINRGSDQTVGSYLGTRRQQRQHFGVRLTGFFMKAFAYH